MIQNEKKVNGEKIIEINNNDLPFFIIFKNSKGQKKDFILKTTSNGEKLLLNKKEY